MNARKIIILGSILFGCNYLTACGKDKTQTTTITPSATEVSVKVGGSFDVIFEHDLVDGITSEFVIGNENLIAIYKSGNSVTIFGLEEGETTLTKKYNGASATISITVLPKDKVHSVKLVNYQEDEIEISVNQEADLKAKYYLDDEVTNEATFTYNVIGSTSASMDGSKFKATESGNYTVKITPSYKGEINYDLIKDISITVTD